MTPEQPAARPLPWRQAERLAFRSSLDEERERRLLLAVRGTEIAYPLAALHERANGGHGRRGLYAREGVDEVASL